HGRGSDPSRRGRARPDARGRWPDGARGGQVRARDGLTPEPAVTLLAVPNVSEGRDPAATDAIAKEFSRAGARLLDVHSDPDHHRSVFTLAGEPGELAWAVLDGARETLARVDLSAHVGGHPR